MTPTLCDQTHPKGPVAKLVGIEGGVVVDEDEGAFKRWSASLFYRLLGAWFATEATTGLCIMGGRGAVALAIIQTVPPSIRTHHSINAPMNNEKRFASLPNFVQSRGRRRRIQALLSSSRTKIDRHSNSPNGQLVGICGTATSTAIESALSAKPITKRNRSMS